MAKESGLEIADRFADALAARLAWIARSGMTGVPRDNLRPGLRMAVFKRRLIYFRVTSKECRIIRVLHSRQDSERQSFADEVDE
ncbi:MAG: type II toxin-antitoxin system RelE/ParE family toxin [Devosia sp.]|nr:type II toxin-antitoxin system RelE/ParE family toxin [Devosia sp.]